MVRRADQAVPVQDRSLPGVAAVFLDEFHERGWDADLALALCTLCRRTSRPDLRRALPPCMLQSQVRPSLALVHAKCTEKLWP
jgi:hypothetical protein